MTKILICEDIESSAQMLVREADIDDYKTAVLSKDLDRDYIINNLEEVIRKEKPEYMIVDGLNGRWKETLDIAKKTNQDLVFILYTSSKDMIKQAKDMKIPAFRKKSQQELDNMFMFIYEESKRKEQDK